MGLSFVEPVKPRPYNTRRLWGPGRAVGTDTQGGSARGSERRLPLIIVALQAMTSLVVAAGLAVIDNWRGAAWAQAPEAALLAGAVVVVPAAWFAWRAAAERSAGRLLAHGAMKVLLTLTSMALVFAVFEPRPLVFFGTFLLMQVMYVVGPLAFGSRGRGSDQRLR